LTFTGLGLPFFLAGYLLVAVFMVLERSLRTTAGAKTLSRGSSDRGSTMLVGAAFGAGLLLPLFVEAVGVALFSVGLLEGSIAVAVMVAGIGLRVWSARTLGRYYTRTLLTTGGQRVITTGPYARIRHPGYLGDILLWAGFGVLSGSWALALLFPFMFAAAYAYRIGVEEKMLLEGLGEDYAEYRKRTARLIPHVY
jgi:protein-S-isoprenylcysteine O-methyltransferase